MRSVLIWAFATVTAVSAQTTKVSTNARCGVQNNRNTLICTGSQFGNCCSQYGWCGNTPAYCGTGCNPAYGNCNNVAPSPVRSTTLRTSTRASSSSSPVSVSGPSSSSPASPLQKSTNARCGFAYGASPGGRTCTGTQWGNCCSQYSYCGSTEAYCGVGCQPGFGNCNAVSSSSVRSSTVSSSLSSSSLGLSSSSVSSSSSLVSSSSSVSSVPSIIIISVGATSSTQQVSSSVVPSSEPASSSVGSSSSSEISSTVASSSASVSSSAISSTSAEPSSTTVSSSVEPSPTTASSSSIVSTSSLAIPSPSGLCGVHQVPGSLSPQDAYQTTNLNANELSSCTQSCIQSSRCTSVVFSVIGAVGKCFLYNVPLSQYGPLVSISTITLFERSCFAVSPTPSSSVASSTSLELPAQSSTLVSSLVPTSSDTSLSSAEPSSTIISGSSTVSSVSTASPTPAKAPVCGVAGIPSDLNLGSRYAFTQGADMPVSTCTQSCFDSPECAFLAYRQLSNGWGCFLFDTPLSQYAPLTDFPSIIIYERDCFTVSSSSTVSSVAPSTLSEVSTQGPSQTSSSLVSMSSDSSSSEIASASLSSMDVTPSTVPASTSEVISSASSVASSDVASSSSSTIASSSSELVSTSSSLPSPTPFCLKVVTPGHPWVGNIARNQAAGNFLMTAPETVEVAPFILQSDGKLTSRGIPVVVSESTSYASYVRSMLQSVVDTNIRNRQLICSISARNSLDCTASGTGFKFVTFTKYATSDYLLMSTAAQSESNKNVDLGIFYGVDCGFSAAAPSSSDNLSASSTVATSSEIVLSTSAPNPSSSATLSSSDVASSTASASSSDVNPLASSVASSDAASSSSSDVASSTVAPSLSSSDVASASSSAASSSDIVSASSTAQSSSEIISSSEPAATSSDMASVSSSVAPSSSGIISSSSSEVIASTTPAPSSSDVASSSSSDIISSTSSNIASTSDAVSSSSIEPSVTVSSSDISSSIEPSATSSEVASSSAVVEEPPCVTLQPNYVQNPGFVYQRQFDTSFGYYRLAQQGPAWSDSSWVWNTAGRYDANGFQGSTYAGTSGKTTSKLTIIQDNIALPDGAQVDVKVDFNQRRKLSSATEPFNAVLRLDDIVIATFSAADAQSRRTWVTLGNTPENRVTVTGDGAHSISLEVTTGGVADAVIFWADNFSITVVQAPNVCPV